MKPRIILAALALLTASAYGQSLGAYNGACAAGGQALVTQGLPSAGTQPILGGALASGTGAVGSFPNCRVTVYLTGTTTQANPIYANASGSQTISNPFKANSDSSFLFFASTSGPYDTALSGGGLPAPVTLTGITLFSSCSLNGVFYV